MDPPLAGGSCTAAEQLGLLPLPLLGHLPVAGADHGPATAVPLALWQTCAVHQMNHLLSPQCLPVAASLCTLCGPVLPRPHLLPGYSHLLLRESWQTCLGGPRETCLPQTLGEDSQCSSPGKERGGGADGRCTTAVPLSRGFLLQWEEEEEEGMQ